MKKKKVEAGVPMRLDDKSIQRVPPPRPSRSQIIEALVTLKINQVIEQRAAYWKETQRLEQIAKARFLAEIPTIPFSKYEEPKLPNVDCFGEHCGKLTVIDLEVNPKYLSKDTLEAIETARCRTEALDPNYPNIRGVYSSNYSPDNKECRDIVRKTVREQLAKKEGTNADRLTPMLADATFRSTMENLLAKLEGKAVVDAESESVTA